MFWNPKLYMITLSSTILSNIRYPGLDERQALIVCILINSVAFGLNMAMLYKVSEAYGKPKKFSILLMFFPYIFLPFIAGSKVEPKLARPPKKKRKKEKVPLIYVPLGINDIAAAKFKKEKEKENSRKEE